MSARRAAVALGLLLTLGLVPLHLYAHRHAGALWRDEVNSVNVATLPSFADAYAHSHLDSFPAAWVLVLHGWVRAGLGDTDAGLRRLGLGIGLGMIGTVWWTGRRLGLDAPLVTLLLFALSPTTIVYGDEVRGYGLGALALLWSLGATWAFVQAPGWRTYLVAQAAAILAAQTYFGNCFLLVAVCGAGGALCLRRRDWGRLAAVLALGGVAALTMLVNLFSVRYAAALSPIEQGQFTLPWFVEVFRHALAPGVPALSACWVVAPAVAVAGCALAWRTQPERALYAPLAAIAGVAGYAAYLSFIQVRTQFWYYLPLMGLVAFACDVGIALLAERMRRGPALRVAGVALAALLVVPGVAETVPLRLTNLDLVAATIAHDARRDDLVVVLPWHCGITFARYYDGPAPWITWPDFDEHKFHLHAVVLEKMQQGDAAIARELGLVEQTLRAGGRVWVVGLPPVPAPGQPLPRLPPAPPAPRSAAPYLDAWEQQLGVLLETRGRDGRRVELPDPGRVNTWENLPLFVVEGWR